MLSQIDMKRRVPRAEYKRVKPGLEIRLAELQRQALQAGLPVTVIFEGWGAAGKGTLINELILPLDPRGVRVRSALPPNEEEALRPYFWRFWTRTPARGRMVIFDRSWHRRLLLDRIEEKLSRLDVQRTCRDIRAFERQLTDDGCVLIKLFLHISRKEQKRRMDRLRADPVTAWRVTADDLRRNRRYDRYLRAAEEALAETEADYAPWTIIEAHSSRYAVLKTFRTVIAAIERGLAQRAAAAHAAPRKRAAALAADPAPAMSNSILDGVDLARTLTVRTYRRRLKARQHRLRELEHEIYMRRVPVVVAYEGWDAAGKGGNIRRLTAELDPRGYEVVPICAPNDVERAHHHLWRFWTQLPKAGHITIFDRTWYGRVLVERVEGFCSEDDWRRAYREINEFERHLTDFGLVLVKFWLHISPEEQLRRFKAREQTPHKHWKITAEDWRNRRKWGAYKAAVEEMLLRTGTPAAPWTIVESDGKWFARVKTLDTVIEAIERRLGG